MFTCDDEMKAYLERWAETENRTVSNLIETLVGAAIAARETKNNVTWDTIADLVRANLPKLREAANIKNLQAIADGAKPTLADRVKLAHALDMLEEDIDAIYRRSFPAKGAKEKEPNSPQFEKTEDK